jgi:hypothetical protein
LQAKLNATTIFSFWPEAIVGSNEYNLLEKAGCLINADLGGRAIDTTVPSPENTSKRNPSIHPWLWTHL